jgi:hypothetical protein
MNGYGMGEHEWLLLPDLAFMIAFTRYPFALHGYI